MTFESVEYDDETETGGTAPPELDPQAVRKIARDAVQRASRRRDYIGSAITEHDVMREILASGDRTAYGRLTDAVREEMSTATVTVSWPDEQPQDERDGDVRAVAEAVSILEGMLNDSYGCCADEIGRVRGILLDAFARPLDELDARDATGGAK